MTEDQKDTLQELTALLHKFDDAKSYRNIVKKAAKALNQVPIPGGIPDASALVKLMGDYMGMYMSAELVFHMQEHGGENCTKEILEYHLDRIRQRTLEITAERCDAVGITNTLVEPDHNAKVAAEILAECED